MSWSILIAALISVESGGDSRAIGDGGRARGPLQIHQAVIIDVNKIYGTHFTHADAHDQAKAAKICELYLSHYATPQRLGRQLNYEDAARIWNGGPDGYKKETTLKYWNKVKVRIYE